MFHWKTALVFTSLLLNIITESNGYPDGTGIMGSCSSLVPGHGSPPQNTPPPYKISFSPTSYSTGTSVSVTISTCSGTGFKGFLIQARRADKSQNQIEMLGSFSSTATNVRQTCEGNRALAHTENSDKLSLSLTWQPPASPSGHIVFRATFVKVLDTYWTDVISDVLLDASLNVSASNTLPATALDASCPTNQHSTVGGGGVTEMTTSTVGSWGVSEVTTSNSAGSVTSQSNSIVKDSSCGVTKGCFSSCRNSACSFMVSWHQEGDYGLYTITADTAFSTSAYVALGFSTDDQMGDDSLTGCASRSNGSVVIFNGRNTEVLPVLFTDNNVTLENYTSADGILSCTFKRQIVASPDGRRVDISKPWVLLFAVGLATVSVNDDVSLQYHGHANRFASTAPYKVSDIVDSAAANVKSPLIRAHGSLMVGAWIFLASIGIVVARYYKPVWTNLILSQKVWFQIHRTSMVLVFACTVAGFIIIFVEVQGWSQLSTEKDYLKAHPIMGLVVTALTIINPGMALFRPHPDAPKRPIFNWAHWFVGMAAHILGVITVYFGVKLDSAGVPYYLIYIIAAYVAWQIFVMLLLEVITCYGHKSDRKDMYELRAGDGEGSELNYPLTESSLSTLVKRITFVAHIVIVGGLTIALIVIIAED
ncbi:hypothetical protein BsWGS_02260 [Bradybaena similaris]